MSDVLVLVLFAALSCSLTRYLQQRPTMNLHTLPTAKVGLEANVLPQSDRGRLQSPMADISDSTSFSTCQPRQGVFAFVQHASHQQMSISFAYIS